MTAPNEDTGPAAPAEIPGPAPTPAPGPTPAPAPADRRTPPRTRAGSTWVLACVAVVVLIVLIVFIAQNTSSVRVSFFALHGRFPLSVALLAAVAVGSVLTLAVGTTRILQLRRIVRRHHREELTAARATDEVSAAPAAPTQVSGEPHTSDRSDPAS